MSSILKIPLDVLLHILKFLGTVDMVNLLSSLASAMNINDVIEHITAKRYQTFDEDTEDCHLIFLLQNSSQISSSVLDFNHCRLTSFKYLSKYINATCNLRQLVLQNCLSSYDISQLQLGSNLEKLDISYNTISSEHVKVFLLRNKERIKNLSHLAMAACGEHKMTSDTDKEVRYISC